MNSASLLEDCIMIEKLCGQIYEIFRTQQPLFPEIVLLWEKTAQEEFNHEQQFILAKRLARAMDTVPGTLPGNSRELVRELADIKSSIIANPLAPTESLRLAIRMEEKLAAFHLDQMRVFADESINRLFTSMMMNDNCHLDHLKQALAHLTQTGI